MNAADLKNIVAGFDHEAFGSQAVFRVALDALSHPGRVFDMPLVSARPHQGHRAAAALLLGLLDADTKAWLSPTLANSEAPAWLRSTAMDICSFESASAVNKFTGTKLPATGSYTW